MKDILKEVEGLDKEELELRVRERLNEYEVLTRESGFLSKEFNAEVRVYKAGERGIYDPKGRAKLALPWRPALYIEGEALKA